MSLNILCFFFRLPLSSVNKRFEQDETRQDKSRNVRIGQDRSRQARLGQDTSDLVRTGKNMSEQGNLPPQALFIVFFQQEFWESLQ